LFLLRPLELVQPEDNQLVRVAHDEDKLAALRTLFGSTHNLTSLQPVIVVEGGSDDGASHTIADRRLYRALHHGFDRATLISGGGKQECVVLARGLQQALAEFSTHLKVVALLDKDIEQSGESLVRVLPVSMIENLLVDPEVIFAAIESVLDRTTFRTVEDVANALDELLTTFEVPEIGRRAAAAIGASHFHPPSDQAKVREKADAFIAEVRSRYSDEALESARVAATQTVHSIRSAQRRREEFDGKKVLAGFFRQHLQSSTLSRQVFAFYAARRARRRRSVVEFFDRFFGELTK
jgi:hypothetical protein